MNVTIKTKYNDDFTLSLPFNGHHLRGLGVWVLVVIMDNEQLHMLYVGTGKDCPPTIVEFKTQ